MSFTFDPALSSDSDKVRLIIGDTVQATLLFEDETIQALITSEGSVNGAALKLAENLMLSSRGVTTKKVGSLTLSKSSGFYEGLVKQLRRAISMGAGPYCGGISQSDKGVYEQNADRVTPIFTRNQFSHPEVDQTELAEE